MFTMRRAQLSQAPDWMPACMECRHNFYGEEHGEPDFDACGLCYGPLHEGDCYAQHINQCVVGLAEDKAALNRWCEAAKGWHA